MINYVHKVCPVILRRQDDRWQILAFHHPQAGTQLIKGTLEPGEHPEQAVLRELAEESGITRAHVVKPLGEIDFDEAHQHWHMFLCQPDGPLPDQWSFFTADGGGHLFQFFWQDLDKTPDKSWYPLFRLAFAWIQNWQQQQSD